MVLIMCSDNFQALAMHIQSCNISRSCTSHSHFNHKQWDPSPLSWQLLHSVAQQWSHSWSDKVPSSSTTSSFKISLGFCLFLFRTVEFGLSLLQSVTLYFTSFCLSLHWSRRLLWIPQGSDDPFSCVWVPVWNYDYLFLFCQGIAFKGLWNVCGPFPPRCPHLWYDIPSVSPSWQWTLQLVQNV